MTSFPFAKQWTGLKDSLQRRNAKFYEAHDGPITSATAQSTSAVAYAEPGSGSSDSTERTKQNRIEMEHKVRSGVIARA